MAKINLVLQAVTHATHAKAISDLLGLAKVERAVASVAFVREAGLDALEAAIGPVAKKTMFFAGIRNDITSVQAIKRLLKMGVQLYVVDTGSRQTIFHPKLYVAASTDKASAVIGSANVTFRGLHNNIEVSALIELDLMVPSDKEFVEGAFKSFSDLIKDHPKHVFRVKTVAEADELFVSGRLVDEQIIPAPTTTAGVKAGNRDDLPPMKLNMVASKKPKRPALKPPSAPAKAAAKVGKGAAAAAATPAPKPAHNYTRVWESKELNARDLSIPKNPKKTAPTGSMGLKKGAYDGIDQRHYFRDEVFADVPWTKDGAPSIWERAHVNVELVVKNLNYGVFNLMLSHNTDKQSKSYKQKNFMTQLHWGAARAIVGKSDLLGRTLYLYRKDTDPPEFMIEID